MINKERLIAMTDAIIAVAATIMVLRLDVPDKASLQAVHEQWTVLLAYLISFTQIFLAWHEHHDMFIFARKINHRIFLINCLWLLTITMIPFVTGVVGNSPNHRESLLLYIGILLLQNIVLMIESRMLSKLNSMKINDYVIINRIRAVTVIGYAIAVIFAFLKPVIAFVIIILICIVSIVMLWMADRNLNDADPEDAV